MPCLSCPHVRFASQMFLALALSRAGFACADAQAEAQRALLQRQQQSDEFALRVRQSQQMANPGRLAQQQRLETLNLEQRQRLQNLNDQQLLQLQAAGEDAAWAIDSIRAQPSHHPQRFEQERQLQMQDFERQQRELQRELESSTAAPR